MSLPNASPEPKEDVRPPKTAARTQKALFYLTMYNISTQIMSSPNPGSKPAAEPSTKTTFLSLPLELRQSIFCLSYDSQCSRLAQIKDPQSLHKGVPHSLRNCRNASMSPETRFQELRLLNEIKDRAHQDHLEMAMWARVLQKTHQSFVRETDYVEKKWADELSSLEEKVRRELWECRDKCRDAKNWGCM